MPPTTPAKRTVEASTEPAISGLSEPTPASTVQTWWWFCANPDHPGLAQYNLKDPNHAIERAFQAPNDPAAEYGGAPVCPACKAGVLAYPIENEGDIPDAIKRAPY